MPTSAFAVPLVLMAAQGADSSLTMIHRVGCHIAIDGVCQDGAVKIGGRGGSGGNATVNYYFNLGGPQGGGGGDGGGFRNAVVNRPSTGKIVPINVPAGAGVQSNSSVSTAPVSLVVSRCKLTIAGKAAVDAMHCQYEKIGKQFTLTAPSDNKKYTYKIKVALNEDLTGQGYLSGGTTTDVRNLGKLMRNKACWVSEDYSVEICAWK